MKMDTTTKVYACSVEYKGKSIRAYSLEPIENKAVVDFSYYDTVARGTVWKVTKHKLIQPIYDKAPKVLRIVPPFPTSVLIECDDCEAVYYTYMDVKAGNLVAIQDGLVGTVIETQDLVYDPIALGHSDRIITEIISNKEDKIMTGSKILEVRQHRHTSTVCVYTDVEVEVGTVIAFGTDTDMLVGVVTGLDPDVTAALAWMIDTIDTSKYVARKDREKKAAKLRAKLDIKRKQFQDLEILKLIAKDDPDTAKMLEEYMGLL